MKKTIKPEVPDRRGESKRELVGVNERGRRIGEDHPRAVLTDHEVSLIFELRSLAWGYARIAAKLEVSKRHVRNVLNGNRRAHFPAGFKLKERGCS